MDNLVAEVLKVRIENEVNTNIKKWGVRIRKIDLQTLPEFKVKIELKGDPIEISQLIVITSYSIHYTKLYELFTP